MDNLHYFKEISDHKKSKKVNHRKKSRYLKHIYPTKASNPEYILLKCLQFNKATQFFFRRPEYALHFFFFET